jgi:hypothetical protein
LDDFPNLFTTHSDPAHRNHQKPKLNFLNKACHYATVDAGKCNILIVEYYTLHVNHSMVSDGTNVEPKEKKKHLEGGFVAV